MVAVRDRLRSRAARADRARRWTGAAFALLLPMGAWLLAEAHRSPRFAPAAWVSLLPLFAAIRILRPAGAAAAGLAWGASLVAFSLLGGAIPAGREMGAAALLTLLPALYALASARLPRRGVFPILALGLGWIGIELALQPLELRHGLLAATQQSGPVFRMVAGALGYAFVAFLVAVVNAALAGLLDAAPRRPGRRPRLRRTALAGGWLRSAREPLPGAALLSRAARPRAPPLLAA
ncbi:MAG TPA: hypothetical protein VJV23_16895 [Candidatus Polarisedimenticolia bacterium]|nr:hypothetical protein [Candidatus Polarisedimenticolia bacterium]